MKENEKDPEIINEIFNKMNSNENTKNIFENDFPFYILMIKYFFIYYII